MKTMKYISLRVLAIAALALAFAMPAKAQLSDNGYANVDWQFNAPLKNHFADKASGWGMNFEGGYFVTPNPVSYTHLVLTFPVSLLCPDPVRLNASCLPL